MKWSITMVVMVVIAYWLGLAPPAGAQGQVFGLAVEITHVAPQNGAWRVTAAMRGTFTAIDPAGCGQPALGPAYAQYVHANGTDYRTLHSGACAYPMRP